MHCYSNSLSIPYLAQAFTEFDELLECVAIIFLVLPFLFGMTGMCGEGGINLRLTGIHRNSIHGMWVVVVRVLQRTATVRVATRRPWVVVLTRVYVVRCRCRRGCCCSRMLVTTPSIIGGCWYTVRVRVGVMGWGEWGRGDLQKRISIFLATRKMYIYKHCHLVHCEIAGTKSSPKH